MTNVTLIVAENDNRTFVSTSFVYIRNTFLECEDSVKLLGVKIDNDLTLNEHGSLYSVEKGVI